jgi:hypothetical protein
MRLRKSNMTWQQLDDEIVILDLAGGEYLSVNGSGAHLWKELDAGADRGQLIESLRNRYALSPDRAAADVDAFLEQLGSSGLLET